MYTRRVSFNNLDAEEPGEPPVHNPFLPVAHTLPLPDAMDFLKVFGNYTFARKRMRLPDPPARSILRNRLSAAQLSSNIQHALLAESALDGDLNELVAHPKHVPRLELARVVSADGSDPLQPHGSDSEDDGESAVDDTGDASAPAAGAAPRRKLYVGMSDEELMALDPQFAPSRHSDLGLFRFDLHASAAAAPARRGSAPALMLLRAAKQIIYPLLNENNYRAVLLTAKHAQYDRTREPRTLLTVLSGRKHTWNAVDWLMVAGDRVHGVQLFLIDGDHLVVTALVPLRFMHPGDTRRRTLPEAHLTARASRLLAYIVDGLPSHLEVKVTVEMVLDEPAVAGRKQEVGTKYMLHHVFRQYQPTLVVVGNRSTNLNFRYRLRSTRAPSQAPPPLQLQLQPAALVVPGAPALPAPPALLQLPAQARERDLERYLCKLLSYLVRHSPVPVVLVGNRTVFHRTAQPAPPVQMTFTNVEAPQTKSIYNPPGGAVAERKNSASSDMSIESFCGQVSSSDLVVSAESVQMEVAALAALDAESRFQQMVAVVLLALTAQLQRYLELVREHGVEGLPRSLLQSKTHEAYISKSSTANSSAAVRKVKSLISYSEEDEKMNEIKLNRKKSASLANVPPPERKKKLFLQKMRLKK